MLIPNTFHNAVRSTPEQDRGSGEDLQFYREKTMRRLTRLLSPIAIWFLAGCASVQSTSNVHGPAARSIANVSWFMTVLFLTTTLVMWILVALAFTRRKGTLAEHAPPDTGGGQMWLLIGGFAVPFIVLSVIFVLGLHLMAEFPIHGDHMMSEGVNSTKSRVAKPDILVTGYQWWWKVEYFDGAPAQWFTTANEIHIPTGRPVNIELQSADVIHSFWVPSLHGKVDMIPGNSNFIRLEATDPGNYKGQCGEYCGAEHAHMRLLVVAQPPDEYAAWLVQQRKQGVEPTTQQAIAGKQLFLSNRCAQCHEVRGTPARGQLGPGLTHIGSRQYIAGDSFPNNDAYLEAWITNAQSLKPEARMPNFPQFTGEQMIDLVAYLRQLK